MSAPVPAAPPSSNAPDSTNLFTRRVPKDSPPPRRLTAEFALLGGAALLITSSVINLLQWSESYREIDPIGMILVLQGIVGILLALLVVRLGTLGLALAGAIYLALTTALVLLASGLELFGYQDGLPVLFTARSIIVPIVGLALLATAAWLISPPQRKPRPKMPEAADDANQGALEPSTLIPGPDEDGIERMRWPAQRPHRMQLISDLEPEPEAPAPQEPATEAEMAAEPEIIHEAEPEPVVAEAELQAKTPEVPGEEMAPLEEPTVQLAGELDAIPDSVHEPLRSMLVREQQILDSLNHALGPDDPATLTIRGNIAAYYLSAGEVGRAADLQEGIAADCTRILGAAHPHTVTAAGKAVQWRKLARKRRKQKVSVPG